MAYVTARHPFSRQIFHTAHAHLSLHQKCKCLENYNLGPYELECCPGKWGGTEEVGPPLTWLMVGSTVTGTFAFW